MIHHFFWQRSNEQNDENSEEMFTYRDGEEPETWKGEELDHNMQVFCEERGGQQGVRLG